MKKLSEMSKQEKKIFLSRDMAERIIRVEQQVSASFNKHILYKDTNYYQSMTPAQRKNFDNYLKNKKLKKTLPLLFLILPLLLFLMLGSSITGDAVKGAVGDNAYSSIEFSLLVLFFVSAIIFTWIFIKNAALKKKLDKNFSLIEDIFKKKYSVRRHKKAFK